MKTPTQTQYLLVKASGGGGLGDCIKSLLVGVLYALKTNRSLIVDWSGSVYAENNENPFAQFFEVIGVTTTQNIPESNDVFPTSWQGRLEKSLHEVYTEDGWQSWDRSKTIKTYSADLGKLNYPQEVLVVWDFDQLETLTNVLGMESRPATQRFRDLATTHLRLRPELQQSVDQQRQHVGIAELGVHIRATKEFQENKGAVGLAAYIAAIEDSQLGSVNMFLATDNVQVEAAFTSRFPKVKSLSKWFAEPGDSLHLNEACPSRAEGLRAAIFDIMLLSYCPNLLLTPGSSFSELAQIFASPTQRILLPVDDQFSLSWISRLSSLLKRKFKSLGW